MQWESQFLQGIWEAAYIPALLNATMTLNTDMLKQRVVLKQRAAPDHCVTARQSCRARAGPHWSHRSRANIGSTFWISWILHSFNRNNSEPTNRVWSATGRLHYKTLQLNSVTINKAAHYHRDYYHRDNPDVWQVTTCVVCFYSKLFQNTKYFNQWSLTSHSITQ